MEGMQQAHFVTENSDIYFGKFEGFSWIRFSGKGNYLSSPALKQCSEELLKTGERCIVIDLTACGGMDSTFMGMLAGLALRLTKQSGGGRLEIARANEKNLQSLEDLGIDAFMEINPADAPWNQDIARIEAALQQWGGANKPDMRERGRLVLEAHKTLSDASEENAKKFASVVNLLEKELGPET
jgi:hypothetical protein